MPPTSTPGVFLSWRLPFTRTGDAPRRQGSPSSASRCWRAGSPRGSSESWRSSSSSRAQSRRWASRGLVGTALCQEPSSLRLLWRQVGSSTSSPYPAGGTEASGPAGRSSTFAGSAFGSKSSLCRRRTTASSADRSRGTTPTACTGHSRSRSATTSGG